MQMHFPQMKITYEPTLFNEILSIANKNGNDVKISSGYLNLTEKITTILSKHEGSTFNKSDGTKKNNV
jgi:hypothetical protein